MIKRDYILNMIEQLIQRLQLLTGLIKLEQWEGAFELLDETMEEFFGWRSDFVNAMPEEALLELLGGNDGRLDVDGVTLLAVLIKSEADVYAVRDDEERAYHRYLRALHLFLAASEADRDRSVPAEWDHTLGTMEALSSYHLPSQTVVRLYRYLVMHRIWDAAEDMLWELGERQELDQSVWQLEGERFYEHLLRTGTHAYRSAELTRDELEDGLREWRARRVPAAQASTPGGSSK